MGQLYLLRHGQSTWNLEDRFTGWADVPLTEAGEHEMWLAGEKLRGVPLDLVYTSALIRTEESARIVLNVLGQNPPLVSAPELNERHYGRLQGLNKAETAAKYGAERVRQWRRSYSVAPPGGESLQDAAARIVPYFQGTILPRVRSGLNVLVCAHGNTIRAIRMTLDDLSENGIMKMEIPTGGLYRYRIAADGQVMSLETL